MIKQAAPGPRGPESYAAMFASLAARDEGAFVPFTVLGDPSPKATSDVLDALVAGGADALELGIPFSDPIADGPVIQEADRRALESGTTPEKSFRILESFRERHPDVPVGLLVYANLVASPGISSFYRRAAAAGVDSVVIADVPTLEAQPFSEAALEAGVAPVLIAPPEATPLQIRIIARLCHGYTYVLTRPGITGATDSLAFHHRPLLDALAAAGAPPPIFGFGISTPEHVRQALAGGAAGAISGSAVVALLSRAGTSPAGLAQVTSFVRELKSATLRPATLPQTTLPPSPVDLDSPGSRRHSK